RRRRDGRGAGERGRRAREARERGAEPEREEGERGHEEAGAGGEAAVREEAAELGDEEDDGRGGAEEGLRAEPAPAQRPEAARGRGEHGRDDEQAAAAEEGRPPRLRPRQADAGGARALLLGPVVGVVHGRVPGGTERDPVVRPEERRAREEAADVVVGAPPAAQRDVVVDEGGDRGGAAPRRDPLGGAAGEEGTGREGEPARADAHAPEPQVLPEPLR